MNTIYLMQQNRRNFCGGETNLLPSIPASFFPPIHSIWICSLKFSCTFPIIKKIPWIVLLILIVVKIIAQKFHSYLYSLKNQIFLLHQLCYYSSCITNSYNKRLYEWNKKAYFKSYQKYSNNNNRLWILQRSLIYFMLGKYSKMLKFIIYQDMKIHLIEKLIMIFIRINIWPFIIFFIQPFRFIFKILFLDI